ncbi:MAG: peptidylprolyl isomerase [Candidatus Rifleibacteriota bacterium]
MAKASFMSMRWLRLHIKEIIWTTVILFVSSIFVIGYGTSRAVSRQKEREKLAKEAEKRAAAQENAIPSNLQGKLNLPVAHISYPTRTASLTTTIDVKSLWQSVKDSPQYQQLAQMPEGIKGFYSKMIKEKALETLITMNLVDLFAQANNIKPQTTAQAIVERDMQQISPTEFQRELRRQGLTPLEWGQKRLKQVTMQAVAQTVVKPVPPASATENFLKSYYEQNKARFKLDDQISFNHLLISPADFTGEIKISDEEVKDYFDNHRQDFVSSKRLSVSHIYIDPQTPTYLNAIEVSDREIRRRYSQNLDKYKEPEKVRARHILIKPRNSFDKDLPGFSINLRNFEKEVMEDALLVSFEAGISKLNTSSDIGYDSFAIETQNGKIFYPTTASQENTENALELPITGATKATASGKVSILLDKDAIPQELIVKSGNVSANFAIDSAFNEEDAFAAAKKESEEILEEINNGKDFAKMAEAHSQDTGSAKKGGDLGAFARGAMVKPFEEVAFSTNVGEITDPVKSQFGYHIIKVEEKIPQKVKKLDEVRPEIVTEYKQEMADIKAENDLGNARQKLIYKTDNIKNLVKLHSMGASRKNDGKLPVFFKGKITDDYSESQKKILAEEISEDGVSIAPEIEASLFTMQEGQVSKVIRTGKGLHLFVLHEILEPVQLSLTPSLKAKIHNILEEEAQRELAKETAQKLRSNYPDAGVEFLAQTYKAGEESEAKVSFEDLPISANPGFSSYALSDAAGMFSEDGRTYLPEVHKTLMKLVKNNEYEGKIAGPVGSDIGYHFIEVTDYQGNRYEEFEEIKDKLKKWVTLQPSQKDIQEYFEENREQFAKPAKREIRQIVCSDKATAEEVYQRLKKGEIFALLAKKFSIDSGSAQRGGLIPPVKKGQLSKNLEKAVWQLEKGEFTEPVKTPYGFVVAYLNSEEIPGSKAELTPQVVSTIKKELGQKIQEEAWMSFIKGLQNKAYVIRHPQTIEEI